MAVGVGMAGMPTLAAGMLGRHLVVLYICVAETLACCKTITTTACCLAFGIVYAVPTWPFAAALLCVPVSLDGQCSHGTSAGLSYPLYHMPYLYWYGLKIDFGRALNITLLTWRTNEKRREGVMVTLIICHMVFKAQWMTGRKANFIHVFMLDGVVWMVIFTYYTLTILQTFHHLPLTVFFLPVALALHLPEAFYAFKC